MSASPTLPRDQNPLFAINPAIGHLSQHLGGRKQQSTLDSQPDEGDDAQAHASPALRCVVCFSGSLFLFPILCPDLPDMSGKALLFQRVCHLRIGMCRNIM